MSFLVSLKSVLFRLVISFPSIKIFPLVGSSSLFKHLISVDFPAPLNPIIPNISPFLISILMF